MSTKTGELQETINAVEKNTINAVNLKVDGNVSFENSFRSKGRVNLNRAAIEGDLCFEGAVINNPSGFAIFADSISVKGSVLLRHLFMAIGEVRFPESKIENVFDCNGATFINNQPGGVAFNAKGMLVESRFIWMPKNKPIGIINLLNAHVAKLQDDLEVWPDKNHLLMEGFKYGGFAEQKNIGTVADRIKWIELQSFTSYTPQPYEQLAEALRKTGHENDARKVLIAKQESLRKCGELKWPRKFWYWLLYNTVRYGWQPERLLFIALGVFLFGCGVFWFANSINNVMQPSKERVYMAKEFMASGDIPEEYPEYNAFIYSLDTFLPIVDLHQEAYWLPDVNKNYGTLYRWYFWFHIVFGWVSTTLLVASLTRIIRKE